MKRYWGLVLVRIGVLFMFNTYIHPDEHMQCGEVMAHIHFGVDSNLPWEYHKPNIARSFVSPELLCGIPMLVLGSVPSWWVIKLWMLSISLLMDLLAFYIFNRNIPLLLLRASSWTHIVLSTKTFSNTLEALLVDMLLMLLVCNINKRAIWGGIIVGLGCFVRITFPAFAVVLIGEAIKREHFSVRFVCQAAGGFVLACWSCLILDFWLNDFTLVFAQWENIKYNSQVNNLAKHGLHPRWTHLLINFPLLFGPVGLAALWRMSNRFESHALVVPLAMLSAFPHQEFRFLFPLQTLCMLMGGPLVVKSRLRIGLWMMFNLILVFMFGIAHQAGVIDYLQVHRGCQPVLGQHMQ
ncbi:hypothetical protein BASA81_012437 [Batrachochytrium salamandrivorans]|nr:hypothetical protein BASA81_012437 [Batrachochytrium salamandrivorans]